MTQTVRDIEVKTPDGHPILVLHLVYQPDNPSTPSRPTNADTKQEGIPSSDDTLMTEAQKRYLFRIMAERGVEEDNAHDHLKQAFEVDSLKDVSKADASEMIKQLLAEAEQKGGQ